MTGSIIASVLALAIFGWFYFKQAAKERAERDRRRARNVSDWRQSIRKQVEADMEANRQWREAATRDREAGRS